MKITNPFFGALLGLALLLLASPALAADEPPPYGASDLVLEDEGLADGWEVSYDELPGTIGEEQMTDWLAATARTAGVEEDAFYAEIRVLDGPDDAAATLAVVEMDAGGEALAEALKTRGQAAGYLVRPLGHASRVLIIEGAAAKAIEAMQLDYAVRSLAKLGFERLVAGSQVGAIAFAKGAQNIQKKAGAPLVLLGMAAAKLEKFEDAVEAFRAGFQPDAPIPAEGRVAMRGNAFFGFVLLKDKSKAAAKEAVKVLERAVALEKFAEEEDTTFATRQNLARAYVRTGQLDRAFPMLQKALEMGKIKLGGAGLMNYIKAQVGTAEEWKPYLEDERFKRAIENATGQTSVEEEEGL